MATYPSKLPAFLARDYGYTDHDNLYRTDISGGAEAVAQRTGHNGSVFQVSSRMSYCQLRLFEGFWAYLIRGGFDWFEIDLDVGTGIATHTARFDGPYKTAKDGLFHWIVSGTLTVDERVTLSHDEIRLLSYNDDFAGMIHDLVHVTLPGIWGV